jgi:hypothetical protein
MPTAETPTQRLASIYLGQPLRDFVVERRPKAWQVIARELSTATNGQINISGEALRLWYAHEVAA